MTNRSNSGTIERLRQRLARLEGAQPGAIPSARATALPLGPLTFAAGALHELVAPDYRDAPAMHGLAAVIAGRMLSFSGRPAVWVGDHERRSALGRLYGYGLSFLGAAPDAFIVVAPASAQEALWATQEAAQTEGVGCVFVEFCRPHSLLDLTATRRLQLAAEKSGAMTVLLRSAAAAGPSSARTRWRVSSAPSAIDRLDAGAPGNPRWRIVSERGGRGEWVVEWDHETGTLQETATHHGGALSKVADRPATEGGELARRPACAACYV